MVANRRGAWPSCPPAGSAALRCPASDLRNGSSRSSSTSSSRGQTDRSGGQGSESGSNPQATLVAVPTRDPGKGKSALAHTPSRAPPRPQPVRQALGQPPLDPPGGYGNDLVGQRVGCPARQEIPQPADQLVRPLRAMYIEHPSRPPAPRLWVTCDGGPVTRRCLQPRAEHVMVAPCAVGTEAGSG